MVSDGEQMNAVHTLQAQRLAHGVQQADDEAYINSVKGARPLFTQGSLKKPQSMLLLGC